MSESKAMDKESHNNIIQNKYNFRTYTIEHSWVKRHGQGMRKIGKLSREIGKIRSNFFPEAQFRNGNQVKPNKYKIKCQKVIQRANKLIL